MKYDANGNGGVFANIPNEAIVGIAIQVPEPATWVLVMLGACPVWRELWFNRRPLHGQRWLSLVIGRRIMQHLEGYVWGIATVVAMFSGMATMFAVHVGLFLGAFLSLLSCFVRPLRRAVPYLLLMPLFAAAGAWGAFLGSFSIAGRHLEFEQIFQVMTVGLGASATFGGLVGAGLGYLLARLLSRLLQRPTIPLNPPQAAPAAR